MPEVLVHRLPPTWVSRSVRYPRPRAVSSNATPQRAEEVPRSVQYGGRPASSGGATVVISPIERPVAVALPRLPLARERPALKPVVRRRRAVRRSTKLGSHRPMYAASQQSPIWLPAPRRRVIHHRNHRLPTPPPPMRAWAPDHDRRPLVARALPLSSRACLAKLARLKVPFHRASARRGLQTPVVITGPVNGVKLTPMWGRRPALMDCRFALLLYRIAPIIRRVGVDELRYSAFYSYRNVSGTRRLSRHGNGLAADIFEVRGPGGLRASVLRDWQKAAGRPGDCVAGVTRHKARVMRRLACALEYSGLLFQVLTPDSNYAHRNHYHLSAMRVGERPLKNRYAGRRVRLRRRR